MTRYYLSGSKKTTLHLATCHKVNWLSRLLGRMTPWTWAESAEQQRLYFLIKVMGFRPCRNCQPFTRDELQRLLP